MTTTITFDERLYQSIAIEKACYRFSDRFASNIAHQDGKFVVELLAKRKDMSDESREAALNEFRIEVLDQNLREKIKAETAPTRNLILAHAFSRTGLIEQS